MLSSLQTTPTMPSKIRPPRGFISADKVRSAKFVDCPQFAGTHGGQKGRLKKGLVYEEQVCNYLEERIPDTWVGVKGPWLMYFDLFGKQRYAQPDWMGIVPEQGIIYLVEVKLSRVPRAWWQLNKLYKPLVQAAMPEWEIRLVEVANQIAHFHLPETVKLISGLDQASAQQTSFMRIEYAKQR